MEAPGNGLLTLAIPVAISPNLVPRVHFPFGQHQEHGLWPDPKQEVRESRTSDSSTQTQKFETMVVVNGYQSGPSLRLRINWKWPESVFLLLTKRKEDSGDEIAYTLGGPKNNETNEKLCCSNAPAHLNSRLFRCRLLDNGNDVCRNDIGILFDECKHAYLMSAK